MNKTGIELEYATSVNITALNHGVMQLNVTIVQLKVDMAEKGQK